MPRLWRFFGLSADLRHRMWMRHAFDFAVCVKKARLATVTALFPGLPILFLHYD
jgi:hypothetical protein